LACGACIVHHFVPLLQILWLFPSTEALGQFLEEATVLLIDIAIFLVITTCEQIVIVIIIPVTPVEALIHVAGGRRGAANSPSRLQAREKRVL